MGSLGQKFLAEVPPEAEQEVVFRQVPGVPEERVQRPLRAARVGGVRRRRVDRARGRVGRCIVLAVLVLVMVLCLRKEERVANEREG